MEKSEGISVGVIYNNTIIGEEHPVIREERKKGDMHNKTVMIIGFTILNKTPTSNKTNFVFSSLSYVTINFPLPTNQTLFTISIILSV